MKMTNLSVWWLVLSANDNFSSAYVDSQFRKHRPDGPCSLLPMSGKAWHIVASCKRMKHRQCSCLVWSKASCYVVSCKVPEALSYPKCQPQLISWLQCMCHRHGQHNDICVNRPNQNLVMAVRCSMWSTAACDCLLPRGCTERVMSDPLVAACCQHLLHPWWQAVCPFRQTTWERFVRGTRIISSCFIKRRKLCQFPGLAAAATTRLRTPLPRFDLAEVFTNHPCRCTILDQVVLRRVT